MQMMRSCLFTQLHSVKCKIKTLGRCPTMSSFTNKASSHISNQRACRCTWGGFHRCPDSLTPRGGELRTVWTKTFLLQHMEDSFPLTKEARLQGSDTTIISTAAGGGQSVGERSKVWHLRWGGFTPQWLQFVSSKNSRPSEGERISCSADVLCVSVCVFISQPVTAAEILTCKLVLMHFSYYNDFV